MTTADMFKLWLIKEVGVPIVVIGMIVAGIMIMAAIDMCILDPIRRRKKRKRAIENRGARYDHS